MATADGEYLAHCEFSLWGIEQGRKEAGNGACKAWIVSLVHFAFFPFNEVLTGYLRPTFEEGGFNRCHVPDFLHKGLTPYGGRDSREDYQRQKCQHETGRIKRCFVHRKHG